MSIFKRISIFISHIGFFWQEKNNGQIFRWNLLFLVAQAGLLFFRYSDLPPQIPIFYTLPWGESQLGPTSAIYLLPGLSLLVLLINNSLAVYYLKSVPLISRLLVVISLITTIFSFIAIFQIFSLAT